MAAEFSIKIDGTALEDDTFLSYLVDRDMFQPDHCVVELSNQDDHYSDKKIGAKFELFARLDTKIFEGEISAIKAKYTGDHHTTIVIHALNKLARLAHA